MPVVEGEAKIDSVENDICPKCGNFKNNCKCLNDSSPIPQGVLKGDKMQWAYTQYLINEAQIDEHYRAADEHAPLGYFLNRPIIGRDTPIIGGVYTTGEGEALVVDEKYGELVKCYEELLSQVKLLQQNGNNPKDFLLALVFNFIKEKLKYDNDKIEAIDKSVLGDQKVVKLPIDDFILRGVGVCRHQAILAGYLLEKLKTDGYLGGNISVDRNHSDDGGHAWARYENSGGQVIIMDPAQNYLGYADNAKNERLIGIYRWSYDRPDNPPEIIPQPSQPQEWNFPDQEQDKKSKWNFFRKK